MKRFIPFILFFASLQILAQSYQIGNISTTYVDPERNNRNIPTEIFYPASQAGANVPVADGMFPVIVFGHGFVMVYSAYQYLWQALVPQGYIVVLPKTEGSFSPNHLNLGLDLAFLINKMKSEGMSESSVFYGKISANSAMMGHSMGGGASFLGAASNPAVTTLVTFAAAETNPSAIAAAANVQAATLVFAGQNDCVTPPPQHQIPMYQALQNEKKIMITINGGGHCFFADYNFFCSIGEGTCSPSPTITREQQQQTVLSFLLPFFDFQLKGNFNSWQNFRNLLSSSQTITYQDGWTNLPAQQGKLLNEGWNSLSYPVNPVEHTFKLQFAGLTEHIVRFTDYADISFSGEDIPSNFFISPDEGYVLKMTQEAMLHYAGYEHANKTYTLEEGWNILPVLSTTPADPALLFAAGIDHLVMVKEIAGNNLYWPEFNIQTLDELIPGNAYWVKVDQQITIEFE
ncbi:MAG: dienelactone hydrolase family protein [Bacteroidales bacterium]|nr:dienelactone hydrolase family protein [Bacteroidales bacterium]